MLRVRRSAPALRPPRLRRAVCCHAAPPAPRPEVARAAAAVLAPLLLDVSAEPGAAVRRALRAGSGRGAQAGPVLDNDDRAALSRLVLGAGVLRARLAHQARTARARLEDTSAGDGADMLAAAAAAGAPGHDGLQPLREADALDAARVLLALYLMHGPGDDGADSEEGDAWSSADVAPALAALDLPPAVAAALRAASPTAVTWPAGAAGLAARRSLPAWLAAEWWAQLGPAQAHALGAALAAPGPVTVRVNALRATHADVAGELAAAGVATAPGSHAPLALRLPRGRPRLGMLHLPGWAQGRWEVQDEGSQVIANAIEAAPGEIILDLCAGNGGKALALAAAVGTTGRVVAYDVAPRRLAALRASAVRAGADGIIATCDTAEAMLGAIDDVAAVPRGGLAAVLVDAPCSGVGALRRRPGDRWSLRRSDALDAAPAMQRALLSLAAAALLRAGAPRCRLVYATCSLLRQENDDVAAWFTAAYAAEFEPWPFESDADGEAAFESAASPPDVSRHLLGPSLAAAHAHERTLLPFVHGTDGFFVARWRRRR
jgi:16S rRNA (cytosine967-C5)-methyltransferase